jgi:hypothetical protein
MLYGYVDRQYHAPAGTGIQKPNKQTCMWVNGHLAGTEEKAEKEMLVDWAAMVFWAQMENGNIWLQKIDFK